MAPRNGWLQDSGVHTADSSYEAKDGILGYGILGTTNQEIVVPLAEIFNAVDWLVFAAGRTLPDDFIRVTITFTLAIIPRRLYAALRCRGTLA
jgi:hypothetical protein